MLLLDDVVDWDSCWCIGSETWQPFFSKVVCSTIRCVDWVDVGVWQGAEKVRLCHPAMPVRLERHVSWSLKFHNLQACGTLHACQITGSDLIGCFELFRRRILQVYVFCTYYIGSDAQESVAKKGPKLQTTTNVSNWRNMICQWCLDNVLELLETGLCNEDGVYHN